SCGTELTANEDNVVSRQVLAQEPVNSGLSFSVHVGNECCLVVRSIGLDESVKQEDSYSSRLRGSENSIPSSSVGCRNEQVVYTVTDVTLSCCNLLRVVSSVCLPGVVAICSGEDSVHVFNVSLAVSGLFRRKVYDTNLDKVATGSRLSTRCHYCSTSYNKHCEYQTYKPETLASRTRCYATEN